MFKRQKQLAERALAQLEPADFHRLIDPEANSIAIIMKHMTGNMRSRWRDFLTSDGEKPDRNRDAEFMDAGEAMDTIMQTWEAGWHYVFATLETLTPADLEGTVLIRNQAHSVIEAIERQVDHYAYHTGQIVFLAKHLRGHRWQSLSIPKGRSEAFNRQQGLNSKDDTV
jgi:hypothetical protein